MPDLPESSHFTLRCLADGVYAAIANEGAGASSNAGIIDLGGYSLVLDTFETPAAARDLRAAVETLTGAPPRYVINTHAHLDHWMGNQVFADTAILSTEKAREWMPALAEEMLALQKNPAGMVAGLQENQRRMAEASTERARQWYQDRITKTQHQLDALPELRICYPSLTFQRQLFFRGTRRTAELIAPGEGHTTGDCYLILRDECILFMGDLGFFDRQPFMANCIWDQWLERLDELENTCALTFVPGHGPVGGHAEIDLLRAYIRMVVAWVEQAVREHWPLDQLLVTPLPEPFARLSATGLPHEASLRYLYERMHEEERD
jgi:cyclase